MGPPVEAAGQEPICAARLAEQENVPFSAIRTAFTTTSLAGNTVILVLTFDGTAQARCEITGTGNIAGFGAPIPGAAMDAELRAVGEAAVAEIDTTGFAALQ